MVAAVQATLSNLPIQLTSFIGRDRELGEARRLLESTRLLTLTGPGGSGKTRLSIQLASVVTPEYPDNVYFVALAPISDPSLVLPSIAQTVGLHDAREGSLMDHVATHLRSQTTLLVLDNFEQLLSAATLVAELLRKTFALKLIVTSRAALHISGEQEFPVPPLGIPEPSESNVVAKVAAAESVKLFVERARAALPSFALEDTNAACLAQIAERLDGLPLAIELAAARVKVLPPQAMLPRLEHSLGLLVAGARDLPGRQQTLRATIAWSYGLLNPGAQRLLASASVFRGGASLEHIESVCAAVDASNEGSVLTDLEELVDHNLLRRVESRTGARLAMLETIREYAAERLAELPQEVAQAVRQRHAAEFRAVAAEAPRRLTGPDEKDWLDLLELEHNNIRVAIEYYARESPDIALQMAIDLRPFWSARGHFTEGLLRLRSLLERVPDPTPARVRALNCIGWLAVDHGDYEDAATRLAESIRLSRSIGDQVGEGIALAHFGRCKIASGYPADAVEYLDAALSVLRTQADPPDLAIGLLYWGLVAIFTGQPSVACERLAEGVEMCRTLGFRSLGARALYLLSVARVEMGELEKARAGLEEALRTSLELGDYWIIAQHMGAFAGLAAKTGRSRQALQMAGFQAAYSKSHEFSVPLVMRRKLESWLEPARQALASMAASVFAEGEKLTIDEAVTLALSSAQTASPMGALTAREKEVANLVAQGLSNRDIAERLTLSVRTVEVHVDHILTKLNLKSRTQLAAWIHASR